MTTTWRPINFWYLHSSYSQILSWTASRPNHTETQFTATQTYTSIPFCAILTRNSIAPLGPTMTHSNARPLAPYSCTTTLSTNISPTHPNIRCHMIAAAYPVTSIERTTIRFEIRGLKNHPGFRYLLTTWAFQPSPNIQDLLSMVTSAPSMSYFIAGSRPPPTFHNILPI